MSLMRDIYHHASEVKIWLGKPVGSYEEKAIEDLQRLQIFFKLYEKNGDKYGVMMSEYPKQGGKQNFEDRDGVWLEVAMPDGSIRMRRPTVEEMLYRQMTPDMIEARFRLHFGKEIPADWNWSHISKFLSKPWFERVWVIQEALAGSRVWIHCGGKVIPWEIFSFVISWLEWFGLDLSTYHGTRQTDKTSAKTIPTGLQNAIFIDTLKMIKAEKKPIKLSILLLLASRYQATKPRDKVYALLGISSKATTVTLYLTITCQWRKYLSKQPST